MIMYAFKTSFPALGSPQLINLLKACLDSASLIQLKHELDERPELTVNDFMALLEKDFGKDYALQAREEWAAIRLRTAPNATLTSRDWRTFQQQFELAASRVKYKGDREEYDMLFRQLSPYWQERVIREETTKAEGKEWVRITCKQQEKTISDP